jgi:cysteine synthase A
MTVLGMIGRTRLIPLQHMVPEKGARVFIKLEYENPTGSMKDRMALAMVEAAEVDGRLRPGGPVVEYTGGSTGVSLAFVCAAERIPLQIVTSEAFSKEKRASLPARPRARMWRPPSGWPNVWALTTQLSRLRSIRG